ncbi:MAG: ADP-ribosylglycohydrolase family protein [Armatimonadota bacterium]
MDWKHIWLYISNTDLETERRQLEEEGKELGPLAEEFARVQALDLEDPAHQPAAQSLLDKTIELPVRAGFPYEEPSDLEGIRALRPASRPQLPPLRLSDSELLDRAYGAWLGRVAGCLLGKPVEGWRRPQMWGYLKETGRFPLSGYFSMDAPADVREKYEVTAERPFIETVEFMPEDDDTNYTTTGLAIMKRHGAEFTPRDVADFWLREIPILHTCTAERVAYRNLCLLIPPPASARFRNPYREWIGAQIRADFWGYAAPGDPQRAAEYAWRDACVSHVKNGIYGEMWAAAMIAAAFVTDDLPTILEAGLGEIPARCRLAEDVRAVMAWHREGVSYDDASERIHAKWNETHAHDWCHTISNAMVVTLGLLYGEKRFGDTLTRAVQPCFDTDCNGATAGSVIGILHGAKEVPGDWTAPFRDTLATGVTGYHRVRLKDMAEETVRLIHACGS